MDRKLEISVGQRLRRERLYLKLSQEVLANTLGTTARSIRRWERDVVLPQPFDREQICRLFKKSEEVLFGTKDQESEKYPTLSFYWNIPCRRNPFFTGREQILHQLHKALEEGQVTALIGLGGIGKTQTAIEYVYRYAHTYQAILWIEAESRDTLQTSSASFAPLLQLPVQHMQDVKQIIETLKQWLMTHKNWLLIFDNVEDLSIIAEVLPTRCEGHAILTTRLQSTGTLAQRIHLESMTPEEGTLLLLRRAKLLAHDASHHEASEQHWAMSREICALLGGLPLALDQAGAYMEETGCSLQTYRDLYLQRASTLLARRGKPDSVYPYSVSTTFALSFKQVEQIHPAAAELLRLCAFLHPDAIPELLIVQGEAHLGSVLGPVVIDPLQLNEVFAILGRFSLIRRSLDTHTVALHRLLQVVLRSLMDEQTQQIWAERTILIVNQMLPEIQKNHNWSNEQVYFPQVHGCLALIQSFCIVSLEAGRLLCQTGIFLREVCRYPEAEAMQKKSREIFTQVLGTEHVLIALTLNELATIYARQGEYPRAEHLYVQALELYKRLPGSGQAEIAQTLKDLAEVYAYQGKFAHAKECLVQASAVDKTDLAHLLSAVQSASR